MGWEGTLDARQQRDGANCAQANSDGSVADGSSEDCLYLSVYMPSQPPPAGEQYPVMVWIYGGGFRKGSPDSYDGTAMAALEDGAVVVTISYRVGIFGFYGADELRSRDPAGSTGNYGLQDQRAAMAWVHDHIDAFGGDPDNVMIFGQSAGAASVSIHTVSEASWPYFHKAGAHCIAFQLMQPRSAFHRMQPSVHGGADRLTRPLHSGMDSGGYTLWATATWAEKTAEYQSYTLANMTRRMTAISGCVPSDSANVIEECLLTGSTADVLLLGTYNGLAYLPNSDGQRVGGPMEELGITNQFKDAPVFGPTLDCVEIKANPLDELKRSESAPPHLPARGRRPALCVAHCTALCCAAHALTWCRNTAGRTSAGRSSSARTTTSPPPRATPVRPSSPPLGLPSPLPLRHHAFE